MRGRVLILIGAIILLVALVVVVFFVLPQDEEETGPDAAGSAQVESAGGEQPGQVGEGDTTPSSGIWSTSSLRFRTCRAV